MYDNYYINPKTGEKIPETNKDRIIYFYHMGIELEIYSYDDIFLGYLECECE